MNCTLREQLKGARLVRVDEQRELTLVWRGGHGIHAYNDDGEEVSFWNTGSFAVDHATCKEVNESMERKIASGEYP